MALFAFRLSVLGGGVVFLFFNFLGMLIVGVGSVTLSADLPS